MRLSPIIRIRLAVVIVLLGLCSIRSLHADTIVVRTDESVVAAVRAALPGDVVEIRSNDVFHEQLTLQDMQPNITVRAGIGFSPVLQGSLTTTWNVDIATGQENVFAFINTQMNFADLHFRLDITDLTVNDLSEGYQLVKVAGPGEYRFSDCTFELTGHIGIDTRVIGRNLIRLENSSETTFENCDFRYTTNVIRWPTFNNTVGYFQPAVETLSVKFLRCRFDAITDRAGRARCIGAGGGGNGSTEIEVTDCDFGLHRFDSRQHQQAYISPAISNTQTNLKSCVFPAGANRYIGLESGLTVEVERCLFMNPFMDENGGEFYLPDPGGNTITSKNCVYLFDSRLETPFRGAIDGEGRQYEFYHCTFYDLAGDRSETATFRPALIDVSPLSPVHTFHACIFNVPGFDSHLLRNVGAAAPPITVNASSNLINAGTFPLALGTLPLASFIDGASIDPLINPADGFHLHPDSPAIDRVLAVETRDDFDGRMRPIGPRLDVGAHEFNGTEITRPWRQIHVPTDVKTITEATARANRNFDEIIIDSDGPFFETMRGERYQSAITIRAGGGFEPMIVVDSTLDILDAQDSEELAAMPDLATPFFVTRRGSFEGLHWRLDLNNMEEVDPPQHVEQEDVSIRLLVVRSDHAEIAFSGCTFEVFGNTVPGSESAYGMRPTVLVQGAPRCTFDNCDWVYDMDLIEWPRVTAAGIGYTVPEGDIMELSLNNCRFEAIPDTRGRARHVTALPSGPDALPGTTTLSIQGCVFGENRDRFDEFSEAGEPPINRQRQQAHVIVNGIMTNATITDSVFLDGAGRQIGLGDNLDPVIRRCIFEPNTVGFAFLPDGGGGRFHVANSVVRFDSHSYSDPSNDVPIRGDGTQDGDRVFDFVHCLFQDVRGADGNPEVALITINNQTGQTGVTQFENCIIDMPAATHALILNRDRPGLITNTAPTGRGNVVHAGELSAGVFGREPVVHYGEPVWDTSGSDRHHLSTCSLRAIDRVPAPTRLEITVDIDGDPRPLVGGEPGDPSEAHFDVGPDEFTGVPDSEDVCGIRVDPIFKRGDHDLSDEVDITDAINLLTFLFLGEFVPQCLDASDADNSAVVDISDPMNLLGSLFRGTIVIPLPGVEECGPDPLVPLPAGGGLPDQPAKSLGCAEEPPCGETP